MTPSESPYFAAVDLGSNSFHMIICRVNDQSIEVLDKVKEMVQIAKDMSSSGIAPDAQQRALECLSRFAERLRDIPSSQIRAVGTKSLRSASNAETFLLQAELALGCPIDIISGYEEARLVYKGFNQSIANDNNRRLVIDIGGASTEFIIGLSDTPDLLESLSFGCVAHTDRFDLRKSLTAKNMRRAYLSTCEALESIRPNYRRHGWDICYGTSGTMRAIAELLTDIDGGAIIPAKSLKILYNDIIRNSEDILKNVAKLRRDVLPAGIAILMAICDQLKIEKIHVADATLKDGLIFDSVGRLNNIDAREGAVSSLQQQFRVDTAQADRVAKSAHELMKQLSTPPIPGVSRTKILKWAARLHEVGLGISHSSHHNHGFYVLKYSDLAGFGRYEQYILASLVRCHRKKLLFERIEGLDYKAKLALVPLILCLRLAVILNRRREDSELLPTISGQNDQYKVVFPAQWLTDNPLTAASLNNEPAHFANLSVHVEISEQSTN